MRISPGACAFINRFQGGFPITERPFLGVAAELGMREAALIRVVAQLLADGVLSRLGPLYDATRLGGAVTLAALSVPESDFDRVAGCVNSLPAVAHNYRRDHLLNMWFVVASDRPAGVALCLAEIKRLTGLQAYDFPKLREFYLGLWLELDARERVTTIPVPIEHACAPGFEGDFVMTPAVARIIAATQGGLPPVARPYNEIAGQLDLPVAVVTGHLRRMLATGVIRRMGAVPNHYRLGLRGNGMTVWDVSDEEVCDVGERIGALDFVSHCYQRPRHPGIWRYNLFAMLHGRDRAEVRRKAARVCDLVGGRAAVHDVLFSSAVLKKTGLRLAA